MMKNVLKADQKKSGTTVKRERPADASAVQTFIGQEVTF